MDFFQISGSDSLQNCRLRFGYLVLGYLSPTLSPTFRRHFELGLKKSLFYGAIEAVAYLLPARPAAKNNKQHMKKNEFQNLHDNLYNLEDYGLPELKIHVKRVYLLF